MPASASCSSPALVTSKTKPFEGEKPDREFLELSKLYAELPMAVRKSFRHMMAQMLSTTANAEAA